MPAAEGAVVWVVLVMLVHELGCLMPELYQHLEETSKGRLRVVVHLMKGLKLDDVRNGRDFIGEEGRMLKQRVETKWSNISLVDGEITAMGEARERYPTASMFYLCSGSDIPLMVSHGTAGPG